MLIGLGAMTSCKKDDMASPEEESYEPCIITYQPKSADRVPIFASQQNPFGPPISVDFIDPVSQTKISDAPCSDTADFNYIKANAGIYTPVHALLYIKSTRAMQDQYGNIRPGKIIEKKIYSIQR